MLRALMPLFFVFSWSTASHAFINIEDTRRKAGPGFNDTTSLNLGGQLGNTDKFSTALSTLNLYKQDENEYLILADYNVSRTNGSADTNNARGHLRYTRNPEAQYSWESFAQSEFDQFRDLKSRDLIGENLRQRLIKNDHESLYSGYGTFYEYQEWGDREVSHLFRGNFYLAFVHEYDKQSSLYAQLYYQPAWTALNDLRLEFQAGLTANITARLALNTQISVVTETRGAPGVKPTDLTYATGLTFKY